MDLLDKFEELPQAVQDSLNSLEQGESYKDIARVLNEVELMGYTFESGLSGGVFNLQKLSPDAIPLPF